MCKWIFYGLISTYLTYLSVCQITLPNNPIKQALYLHNESISNATLKDCTFRPANDQQVCPDPDIKFILYNGNKREVVDSYETAVLRQKDIWNPFNDDVFIVHGYAGGDDTLPIVVLRDAYIANGSYNVWMVDWGALCKPPCYRAAVNNLRAVAKCTGQLMTMLRQNGLRTDRVTCVGHSLGAHICGLISRYVTFRLHRIIGLDPARPLIPPAMRLDSGDAGAVHVLHTNAGHYGEGGRRGHVDFCINGGRMQPYCENTGIDEQLCSHVWAICYMAESLQPNLARRAEPCSRRCPNGPRPGHRIGVPIMMGQLTPLTATGSYCVRDKSVPYCPKHFGDIGDIRCCLKPPEIESKNNELTNNPSD